jgi:tryptophanase
MLDLPFAIEVNIGHIADDRAGSDLVSNTHDSAALLQTCTEIRSLSIQDSTATSSCFSSDSTSAFRDASAASTPPPKKPPTASNPATAALMTTPANPLPALWKAKMVQRIYPSTPEQRLGWIRSASYNLFRLAGDHVLVDLLTDSGTGAMSDDQWAALLTGDETYAGSSSFERLEATVRDIFGYAHVLPVHQGRAAENVLFSVLVREGHVVPGNAHFDTTKAQVEFRKGVAVDCTNDGAADTELEAPFKGDVDVAKLRRCLEANRGNVPFVVVTVTCNTMGGQPVSMGNIRAVRSVADEFGVPLVLDAARFAENAYFIKAREDGYADKTIGAIVREMHGLSDAMVMSSKKDGLVNIGGLLAMNRRDWYDEAARLAILFEGFTTYGGMAGRDMNALAAGMREALDHEYLRGRIGQVQRFGRKLMEAGIPVQRPVGGHAVYVDAGRLLPHVRREEFPAQTLGVELFVAAGVRGVEVGTLLNGRDPATGAERYARREFLRLVVPRRVYADEHLDYVAAALRRIWRRREQIRHGFRITSEAPVLRHFTVELEGMGECEDGDVEKSGMALSDVLN